MLIEAKETALATKILESTQLEPGLTSLVFLVDLTEPEDDTATALRHEANNGDVLPKSIILSHNRSLKYLATLERK